jgi:hypothetical protein
VTSSAARPTTLRRLGAPRRPRRGGRARRPTLRSPAGPSSSTRDSRPEATSSSELEVNIVAACVTGPRRLGGADGEDGQCQSRLHPLQVLGQSGPGSSSPTPAQIRHDEVRSPPVVPASTIANAYLTCCRAVRSVVLASGHNRPMMVAGGDQAVSLGASPRRCCTTAAHGAGRAPRLPKGSDEASLVEAVIMDIITHCKRYCWVAQRWVTSAVGERCRPVRAATQSDQPHVGAARNVWADLDLRCPFWRPQRVRVGPGPRRAWRRRATTPPIEAGPG